MDWSHAAASRWQILGRAVGLGASWGLGTGAGAGLLLLPYAFLTVPLGSVIGTVGGLLSGLAAGGLMALSETAAPGSAAEHARLLGALGTPIAILVLFAVRPDWFSRSSLIATVAGAAVVLGAGVGAGVGPFIATGLDEFGRRPAAAQAERQPAGVPWLRIMLPVVAAAGMAVVCWVFVEQMSDEATGTAAMVWQIALS